MPAILKRQRLSLMFFGLADTSRITSAFGVRCSFTTPAKRTGLGFQRKSVGGKEEKKEARRNLGIAHAGSVGDKYALVATTSAVA